MAAFFTIRFIPQLLLTRLVVQFECKKFFGCFFDVSCKANVWWVLVLVGLSGYYRDGVIFLTFSCKVNFRFFFFFCSLQVRARGGPQNADTTPTTFSSCHTPFTHTVIKTSCISLSASVCRSTPFGTVWLFPSHNTLTLQHYYSYSIQLPGLHLCKDHSVLNCVSYLQHTTAWATSL